MVDLGMNGRAPLLPKMAILKWARANGTGTYMRQQVKDICIYYKTSLNNAYRLMLMPHLIRKAGLSLLDKFST